MEGVAPASPRRAAWRLVLVLLAVSACAPHGPPGAPAAGESRAGHPVYAGLATVDPATGQLSARWRIRFTAADDPVDLLLNRGFTNVVMQGSELRSHAARLEPDWQRLMLRFNRSAAAPAVRDVDVTYSGVPVFGSDSINGIRPTWVELGLDSFWHPVFAGFTQSLTATLRLRLPRGWTAVSSGNVAKHGDTLVITNSVPLVDVAFAASPAFRVASARGTSVYHTGASRVLVERVLSTSVACSRYLDARYGMHDHLPDVKIVLAPRRGPGYARRNYIVITTETDTQTVPLTRFVCHELAHYWSTGAVASGPENWLNEAFAEYVSGRYVRSAMGDSAWAGVVASWRERGANSPPVWTDTSTRRPSPRAAYGKAPWLLSRLEERVGSATMDRILTRFMTTPLRTTPAVLGMIGEEAGGEAAAWLRQELGR